MGAHGSLFYVRRSFWMPAQPDRSKRRNWLATLYGPRKWGGLPGTRMGCYFLKGSPKSAFVWAEYGISRSFHSHPGARGILLASNLHHESGTLEVP